MTNRRLFLLIITLISVTPLLSSDIYLPAFLSIAREMDETPLRVQLTLSCYLLSLSVFQIIYGLLSDRFGRKALLVPGLALYVLGSLGCALAPTLGIFIA